MKIINFNNFLILESQNVEIIKKYKEILPLDIIEYFNKNNPKEKNYALLSKMLQFYKDNINTDLNNKVLLKEHIINMFKYFVNNQKNLNTDILTIKNINDFKILLNQNSIYYDLKSKDVDFFIDNEEYIIFSTSNFNISKKYGDFAWCVNREFKAFWEHGCLNNSIIQFINKYNSNKNFAIEIKRESIHLNKFLIQVWDSNDDCIYSENLQKFIDKINNNDYIMNIEPHPELIKVLKKLSDCTIENDEYYPRIDDMYLSGNFAMCLEILDYLEYSENAIDELADCIIEYSNNEIIQYICNKFNIIENNIEDIISKNIGINQYLMIYKNYDENILFELFSSFINPEKLLKEYNINYNNKLSHYNLWNILIKKMKIEDKINLLLDYKNILIMYLKQYYKKYKTYNNIEEIINIEDLKMKIYKYYLNNDEKKKLILDDKEFQKLIVENDTDELINVFDIFIKNNLDYENNYEDYLFAIRFTI
jgi:hypothetical protein